MPTFNPPVAAKQNPAFRSRLGAFFRNDVGRTVLKTGSTYTTVQYPSDAQVRAANAVYMGGHVYTISAAEAADLTAAGYGSYIT